MSVTELFFISQENASLINVLQTLKNSLKRKCKNSVPIKKVHVTLISSVTKWHSLGLKKVLSHPTFLTATMN